LTVMAGFNWPLPVNLNDKDLESLLFPPSTPKHSQEYYTPGPLSLCRRLPLNGLVFLSVYYSAVFFPFCNIQSKATFMFSGCCMGN
jgi:hypothetical protein